MTTLLLAAMILAQAPATQAPAPAPKTDNSVTMNGCLTRDYTDAKSVNAYTFIDNTDGARYHAKGRSLSKYSGMSVQVTGVVDTKKVKVVGGLYPNPNVAGQAGSLDPARAAVAAMPGGTSAGTGNVELPTLNVTRLSLGQGECRK
jgi:hypothetical protein